jgi:hypothetical protein
MISLSTIVFLPMLMAILLVKARWLLVIFFVLSAFPGAAFINIGNSGLVVFYVGVLAFIGRSLVELGANRTLILPGGAMWYLTPWFIFAAVAAMGAFALPLIFEGQTLVFPGRAGLSAVSITPLAFRPENLNQLIYLIVNTLFMTLFTGFLIKHGRMEDFGFALRIGVVVISFFAALQFVPGLGPWLQENLVGTKAATSFVDQSFLGFKRVQASFLEPSLLGQWVGAAAGALMFSMWGRPFREILFVGSCYLMLVFSFSTTSYALLVLGLILVLMGRVMLVPRGHDFVKFFFAVVAILTVALAVLPTLAFLRINPLWLDIFQSVTVDKSDTISYRDRLTANLQTWRILLDTYFLGAGLGSNRPSGLLHMIISTTGVLGAVMFVWFFWRQVLAGLNNALAVRRGISDRRQAEVYFQNMVGTQIFVVLVLLAGVFSVADLSQPVLILAICVSIATNVRVDEMAGINRGGKGRPLIARPPPKAVLRPLVPRRGYPARGMDLRPVQGVRPRSHR